jgi:pyridoxamine 5'-phosphate oxidase
MIDIAAMRRDYRQRGLHRRELDPDPFRQFDHWFAEAVAADLLEPNAFSLATASTTADLTLRTVLMKYLDGSGLVFFTNKESHKSRQMKANPRVAALFPWLALERQVSITGHVEEVSVAESLRYFLSRPRDSQLGAWVSQQSQVVSSRSILEMKWEEMKRKFQHGDVPLPSFWGGYRIIPDTFEFWQGRPNRLHDRFLYTREPDGHWHIDRLMP